MQSISEINDAVVRRSNEIYDKSATKHGTSGSAVLSTRQARQYQRFAELARFIDLDNSKAQLLEVGCGNAELYKYLAGRGYRGRYIGTDISEELIAQARRRFVQIDVRHVDIITKDLGEKFDYVVMSGVFNVDNGQTLEWTQQFLRRMFALTDSVMAFNALSRYVNRRDQGFVYLDPAEILTFCIEHLSRRVTLAHHNLSYNYTVAVYTSQEPGLSCEE